MKLRPFSGSASIFLDSITSPSWVVSVSTCIAFAVTFTSCCTLPTWRVTSIFNWSFTFTSMPLVVNCWKPEAVAVTLYVPAGKARMR